VPDERAADATTIVRSATAHATPGSNLDRVELSESAFVVERRRRRNLTRRLREPHHQVGEQTDRDHLERCEEEQQRVTGDLQRR